MSILVRRSFAAFGGSCTPARIHLWGWCPLRGLFWGGLDPWSATPPQMVATNVRWGIITIGAGSKCRTCTPWYIGLPDLAVLLPNLPIRHSLTRTTLVSKGGPYRGLAVPVGITRSLVITELTNVKLSFPTVSWCSHGILYGS